MLGDLVTALTHELVRRFVPNRESPAAAEKSLCECLENVLSWGHRWGGKEYLPKYFCKIKGIFDYKIVSTSDNQRSDFQQTKLALLVDLLLLILVCVHATRSCCHRKWFPNLLDVRLEMLHQFLGVYTRRVYCTATSASYLWIAKWNVHVSVSRGEAKKKRLLVIGNSCILLEAVCFERWFIKLQKNTRLRWWEAHSLLKQREQSSIEIVDSCWRKRGHTRFITTSFCITANLSRRHRRWKICFSCTRNLICERLPWKQSHLRVNLIFVHSTELTLHFSSPKTKNIFFRLIHRVCGSPWN